MRFVCLVVNTIAILAIAACSLFDGNPYANFVVGKVDEEAAEAPAVILVGDPQVSSRESLINDRMREVDHLEEMIRSSTKESFEPQLKRDLRVIRALVAQLGISFNPASGAVFDREQELNELRVKVELTRLRNELARLRDTGKSVADTDSSISSDARSESSPGVGASSLAEVKTRLDQAVKAAADLMNEIQTGAAGRGLEAEINTSPEDHFEDLNAYRARLRQRQNEVRLDDVHDADGHALYRLQLAAGVLPGKVKNKFAVLDVGIAPVKIEPGEVRALYEQWLVELSRRGLRLALSDASPSRIRAQWGQIQVELLREQLVERVPVRTYVSAWDRASKGSGRDTSFVIPLFIYPQDREAVTGLIDDDRFVLSHASQGLGKLREQYRGEKVLAVTADCGVTELEGNVPLTEFAGDDDVSVDKAYRVAKSTLDANASIGVIQVFRALLETTGSNGNAALGELRRKLKVFETVKEDAEEVLEIIGTWNGSRDPRKCFEPRATDVPGEFFSRVAATDRAGETVWHGSPRTYQAQPAERAQRISSVASAVNSMKLAFSLAALLPGQGLGLDAGAAAGRTAIGMVEAVERTPVIIGYTDRQKGAGARFGYIFGPKAVLITDRNRLEYLQQARSYPVFADITVPAWWPAIHLNLRSAWAANWHSGTGVLKESEKGQDKGSGTRSIKVRLRPRLADAGPLTQFILENSLIADLDAPRITGIRPNRVSVCGSERIVFTISGENLWRAPVAYLRGTRHESIRVLPDMRGLEVTFDLGKLPDRPERGVSREPITVWTTLGSESQDVEVVDTRLGVPCQPVGSESGISTSLKPHFAYVVAGKALPVRVNMTAPLPGIARDVRIIYQFLTRYGWGEVHNIPETVLYRGRFAEGSTTVSKPKTMSSQEAKEGPAIRAGLEYRTIDDGAYRAFWADGTMVFYANEQASQFGLETKNLEGLREKIILSPPVKLSIAYPEFVRRRENFSAVVEDTIKVMLSADWNDKSHPGKVVVSAEIDDEKGAIAFATLACEKETTLKIATRDKSGRSPSVYEGTVGIAKQKDGCT